MEFDKSRVYTSLTADELSPGDKVICADDIGHLKHYVTRNGVVLELQSILDENKESRFVAGTGKVSFHLAYLIERKENCTNCKKFPCNDEIEEREVNLKIYSCCGYESKVKMPELISLGNGQYAEKEKQYRPFANTDELVKVWNAKIGMPRCLQTDGALTMPYIWVQRKDKSTGVSQHLITSFNIPILRNGQWTNGVSVESIAIIFEALFRLYEFLDGSPCGIEVEA